MTPAQVIDIAFTRNIDVRHIKQADIDVSKIRYVDNYIGGYSADTAFVTGFVNPVIAFGVAVDCFERLATEISDRGVVTFSGDGANPIHSEQGNKTKNEYARQRNYLIKIMVDEATEKGFEVKNSGDVDLIYTTEKVKTFI